MELRVFDIIDGITKLGPGIRFGIWTQGCPKRCPGCMTPNSQLLDGGYLVCVDELVKRIQKSQRTELTISGGEPFLQAKSLVELITKLRSHNEIGVIVYTGYTYDELQNSKDDSYMELLQLCDLIIDGAYEETLNDGKNLRGSSNKKAILLTDKYIDFAKEIGTKPAEIEFFVRENRISMVGVPTREILQRMKNTSF